MVPVRFGIAGYGRFAERWARPTIEASHSARLVAVQLRGSREIGDPGAVAAYHSIEALVASPEVDAVYVTSANVSHAPDAIAAMRAGKHVLVEKPIATRLAQGADMRAGARRTQLVLHV